jgi:hypothetical protein
MIDSFYFSHHKKNYRNGSKLGANKQTSNSSFNLKSLISVNDRTRSQDLSTKITPYKNISITLKEKLIINQPLNNKVYSSPPKMSTMRHLKGQRFQKPTLPSKKASAYNEEAYQELTSFRDKAKLTQTKFNKNK